MIARSLHRWVQAQDEQATLEGHRDSWISIGLATVLIALAVRYVPGAEGFFHLRTWPLLVAYVPVFFLSVLITWTHRHRERVAPWAWPLILVGNPCVQLIGAAFITGSRAPGAAIFASLFLFAAGYHGYCFRVTFTEPFLAIGTGIVGLIALAMNPDPEHVAIFAVVIPAAVAVALFLGTHAASRDRFRAENDRLRAAIDAQHLAQQEQEMRQLSHTLVEVLGTNHDLRNAVTSAQLVADGLELVVRDPDALGPQALPELSQDLQTSLQRIQALVEQNRRAGKELAVAPERVDLVPVLEQVIAELARSFPQTRLTWVRGTLPRSEVTVRGGELNLRRILHNLVRNGCEGNGDRGASAVTVSLQRDRSGMALAVTVQDDGPGFSPALLERELQPYGTTKAQGTGLGLFTTERLVRASHGTLQRVNAPEGGAAVTVVLPLAAG